MVRGTIFLVFFSVSFPALSTDDSDPLLRGLDEPIKKIQLKGEGSIDRPIALSAKLEANIDSGPLVGQTTSHDNDQSEQMTLSVEERDLIQQRRMADSTERIVNLTLPQLWINSVGALLLFLTFLVTAWTARAALRSARAAEDVIKQNRAWLTLDLIENEKFQLINDIHRMPVRWRNTGQSPALRVTHFYEAIIVPLVENEDLEKSRINFPGKNILSITGNPIGSGQYVLQYFPFPEKVISKIHELDSKDVVVIRVGVSYRTIHDEEGRTEEAFAIYPVRGSTQDEQGVMFMPLEAHITCV